MINIIFTEENIHNYNGNRKKYIFKKKYCPESVKLFDKFV